VVGFFKREVAQIVVFLLARAQENARLQIKRRENNCRRNDWPAGSVGLRMEGNKLGTSLGGKTEGVGSKTLKF